MEVELELLHTTVYFIANTFQRPRNNQRQSEPLIVFAGRKMINMSLFDYGVWLRPAFFYI